MEEVQGLDDTVHGSEGFGSTGVKLGNDTGQISEEKETKGKNERPSEKKESTDKTETLKGRKRNDSGRTRTEKNKKQTTEGSSRLSLERQIISVK